MKKTISKISNINQLNMILFWSVLGGILATFVVYCFFMYQIIGNAVATNELRSEIASLNSELSNNEFSYMSKFDSINLESAKSLGFTPIKSSDIIFVTREIASNNVAIR